MRKLKILAVTMAMTLLFAAPAFAQVFGDKNAVANNGGFVAIDSSFQVINVTGDNNTVGIDSFNTTNSFNTTDSPTTIIGLPFF